VAHWGTPRLAGQITVAKPYQGFYVLSLREHVAGLCQMFVSMSCGTSQSFYRSLCDRNLDDNIEKKLIDFKSAVGP
jgi:hypothetical protein